MPLTPAASQPPRTGLRGRYFPRHRRRSTSPSPSPSTPTSTPTDFRDGPYGSLGRRHGDRLVPDPSRRGWVPAAVLTKRRP